MVERAVALLLLATPAFGDTSTGTSASGDCVPRELTGEPPAELVCSTTKERRLVPDPGRLGPLTDKFLEIFADEKSGRRRIFFLQLGTISGSPPQRCHELQVTWAGAILETQSGACLCRGEPNCPVTRYGYSRERREIIALDNGKPWCRPPDDRPRKCVKSVCDSAGACACREMESLSPLPAVPCP